MVERDMEAAAMAVDSPYDYFITWEDSSTQNYTPVTYDRCIGSEIARWCNILAPARKHYIQHACGHLRALLGTMRNTGILAVESLSPHPTGNITLAEARAIGGSRLGIIGGIEPTEFLRLPLNRLGDYVEQVIADGQGGPFVLANSDSCPPGVTVEKFKRVAEVARAWQP
jgi:uroporphyrinogen-III decarboxylase